jgi:hypothetical protein
LTGGGGTSSGGIGVITGELGPVRVGGDLTGGTGSYSGSIISNYGIVAVAVGGAVVGGGGDRSGTVGAGRKLGRVNVTGDVTGGGGVYSGSITAPSGITAVTLGGSLVGGNGENSGSIQVSAGNLGPVHITGDIRGGGGFGSAAVVANGFMNHTTFVGGGIASITIGGSVIGGTGPASATLLADRRLGPVSVGHDWTGASAVAGFFPGPDLMFGTADDTPSAAPSGLIVRITIGGTLSGTPTAGDQIAFLAHQINAVSVGGQPVVLHAGAKNDDLTLVDPDVRLIEK